MYELITIDVTSNNIKGLGSLLYKTHPQRGDWIEIDVDGQGTMFEVVKVAHSSVGEGSDIYINKVGFTPEAVRSICGS